jgi:hypothetical protein
MPRPGTFRNRIARLLNTAYGDGLLSQSTLAHRLDLLFASRVIEPAKLIGDLSTRSRAREPGRLRAALRRIRASMRAGGVPPPALLALDWHGETEELLLGRDPSCDVVLGHDSVSRRHARLLFRDGSWILQDLDSTNGTTVNRVAVGRCQLQPGDRLGLGDESLVVD